MGTILFTGNHTSEFKTVSYKELLEAATIDGAGNWARFWNVIIPYLIPVLNMVIITQAKAGLTVFDYIKAMTNGGPAQSTEAVFQYNFKSQYSFDYNLAFASYLIAMIPVLIAYACAQKHIVSGLTQGAVKS